jgi:uncharacterized coiled-coil DUF342 family protein
MDTLLQIKFDNLFKELWIDLKHQQPIIEFFETWPYQKKIKELEEELEDSNAWYEYCKEEIEKLEDDIRELETTIKELRSENQDLELKIINYENK